MPRAFAVVLSLLVGLTVEGPLAHAEQPQLLSEIAVMYLFNAPVEFVDAENSVLSLHSHLTEYSEINFEAYLHQIPRTPVPRPTKSNVATCEYIITDAFLNEFKIPNTTEDFSKAASVLFNDINSNDHGCKGLIKKKFWFIISVTINKSDITKTEVRPALCMNPAGGVSGCVSLDKLSIVDFSRKVNDNAPCEVRAIFNQQTSFRPETRTLSFQNRPAHANPFIVNRSRCRLSPDSCLNGSECNLSIGQYDLKLNPGYLWKTSGSAILRDTLPLGTTTEDDLTIEESHINFKIEYSMRKPIIDLSNIKIGPHHARRAGIGLLASVAVFSFVSGFGFLHPSIYNDCLPAIETIPTYRCIGVTGSNRLRLMLGAGGATGALISLGVGLGLLLN